MTILVNTFERPPVIDRATFWHEIGFKPHGPEQSEYMDCTTRFQIPTCGRRWGKSYSSGVKLVEQSFRPETWYWICGPQYKLGEKEFRVVYRCYEKLGLLSSCKWRYDLDNGKMYIETPWKTKIEVVSAQYEDSLQGEGLDGAIMSEAASHHFKIWQQYLDPALSDKRGFCLFPSTPKGQNWYWLLWRMGIPGGTEQYYKSWKFPSWTNRIQYPGGWDDPEIQRMFTATASANFFWQEIGAEFIAFEGQVYGAFDETVHVRHLEYNPAWFNARAWDFGFANPTVVLDIGVDAADNVYVWREYYTSGKSSTQIAEEIKNRPNPDGYHVNAQFGDPSGADEIANIAPILGDIQANPVPWKQQVEAINRALKIQPDGLPKLFIDPSCKNLIRELPNIRTNNPPKNDDKNTREGEHDYDNHCCAALRYFAGEWFVLGAGSHLNDYEGSAKEAHEISTYFQLGGEGISLDDTIGYKW